MADATKTETITFGDSSVMHSETVKFLPVVLARMGFKIRRLAADVFGCPEEKHEEIERRFLFSKPPDFAKGALRYAIKIYIEQIYIRASKKRDDKCRIRKCSVGEFHVYYKTKKYKLGHGRKCEIEKRISKEEYLRLSTFKERDTKTIVKTRYCFLYKNQYFELDAFHNPPNLYILEIELRHINKQVKLPPYFCIKREITDEPAYSNHELARIKQTRKHN